MPSHIFKTNCKLPIKIIGPSLFTTMTLHMLEVKRNL